MGVPSDDSEENDDHHESKWQKWSVQNRKRTGSRYRVRKDNQEQEPSEEKGLYTHTLFSTRKALRI